jgi:polar amino acid transport system permease protein
LFPASLRQSLFFENRLIHWLSDATGLPLPYYTLAAILGLTLNTSAYLAELFRAGVGSLAQEYIDAARSLGASQQMVFWQILLPQGVRAAFPAIATRLIHNMKNTALASFVSAPEFFQMTQTAITYTFRAVEFLLLATAVYLLLALAFGALLRWIEHRLNRRPISVFVNSPTVVAKTGWR